MLNLSETIEALKSDTTKNRADEILKTMARVKLLSPDYSNAKLAKNLKVTDEWLTYIMYLSPAETAFQFLQRRGTFCPSASDGCKRLCLSYGGRAKMDRSDTEGIAGARLRKSLFYIQYRNEFYAQLSKEIRLLERKAKRLNKKLAIRLNGTSDLDLGAIILQHQNIQFYDYTAVVRRVAKYKSRSNYSLTFSRKETNDHDCLQALNSGINVAIPFSKELYNSIGDTITYQGETFSVVDGSSHDMRFLDPTAPIGYIVKLKEIKTKKSKNDTDGFIVRDLKEISGGYEQKCMNF